MTNNAGAQPQFNDVQRSPSNTLESFCMQYQLTARERDVLSEALLGYTMEDIGKNLFISRETVKTHLRHIYRKTSCPTKSALIVFVRTYLSESPKP